MQARQWVDGRADDDVAWQDRGLLFGDGVFETMRVQDAGLPLWSWHRDRLLQAIDRLRLDVSMAHIEDHLAGHLAQLDSGVLRLTLTRGQGGTYRPLPDSTVRLISHWRPLPPAVEEVRATLLQQRLGHQPMLAGLKHLNRLEQVILQAELDGHPDCDEALVQDIAGRVIEGVASNVFMVHRYVLHTPIIDECGVAGVMRAWVLERCRKVRIPTRICALDVSDFLAADEVFFCNAVRGIMPVHDLLGRSMGTGVITSKLQMELTQVLRHV